MIALAFCSARVGATDFKPVLDSAGELVVATVVATDPPYNVDRTGKTDASSAIQAALNDAIGKDGGGIVYLPSGRYRIEKSLTIPHFVTLYGDWSTPVAGRPLSGTILLACADKGSGGGPALLSSDSLGYEGVYNLSVYYPDQSPDSPVAYPFTIEGKVAYVHNVTLYNSYQGILMSIASACSVSGLYGSPLSRGIVLKKSCELCSASKIRFDSSYWTRLPEAAMSSASALRVKEYMASNLTGMQIGKVDGLSFYDADLCAAKTPVLVMMERDEKQAMVAPSINYGFGGGLGKVLGHRTDVGFDPWYFGTHYFDLDNYPELAARSYTFASPRHAAKTSLSDVYQSSAFGVQADGATDDAGALQKALDTAGAAGGGTVLLPHGTTLVRSPLSVPRGVELRGACLPVPSRPWYVVSAIMLDFGQDMAAPTTAAAGITLAADAGVRGIEIRESKNFWVPDDAGGPAVHPSPYAVRGAGPNVYVTDCCFPNADNMIDLGTNRCDGAQVVNLWGAASTTGLFVGGGSANVQLENINIDIGPLGSDPLWRKPGTKGFDDKVRAACQKLIDQRSTSFVFGDCSRLTTFHLAGFAPYRFMEFIDQGKGGAVDAALWSSIFDVPSVETVRLRGATSVDFLGLFATGGGNGASDAFEADPTFRGKVNLYGPCQQLTFCNHSDTIGVNHLRVHLEQSLTTGRKVVDVSSVEQGSKAENALDGRPDTFWVTQEVQGDHTLTVKLDEPSIATRFRLHCAGDYAHRIYNTNAARLEGSADGKTFFELASFSGNVKNWVDVPVTVSTPVSFVRLVITKPQAAGETWNRSTVANFDVFGYPARLSRSITPASDYAAERAWD